MSEKRIMVDLILKKNTNIVFLSMNCFRLKTNKQTKKGETIQMGSQVKIRIHFGN